MTAVAAVAAVSMNATAFAATTNSGNGTGANASCDGAIHGAFADVNGSFGIIEGHADHPADLISGQLNNQTGLNNSAASQFCNTTP
jgi:hypothetical protein